MVKKKDIKKADDVWKQKVEILERLARGDKKTHIAAQFGCDEKYVRDIDKEARKYPSWKVKTLQSWVQEYIATPKRQSERKAKKTKEIRKETQYNKVDPELVVKLQRHWEKLTELATLIDNTWADPYHYGDNIDEQGEFKFSGRDDDINLELCECLVIHLKAEFEEFKNAKSPKDLWGANLKKDNYAVLGVLNTVRDRKPFFKGTCSVCESWISEPTE